MRNNFLLAIAMLLLFVTSCKKDEKLNSTENYVEQDSSANRAKLIEEAYTDLTPEEKKFYEHSYLLSLINSPTNENSSQQQLQAVKRDDWDSTVQKVMEEILLLNSQEEFVTNLNFSFGFPAWDIAKVETTTDDEGLPIDIVHIPFAFTDGTELTSYLLATVNINQEIEFALITRNEIDPILEANNIEFDIAYHVSMLMVLESNLFGKINEKYHEWLELFLENNLQEPSVNVRGCSVWVTHCWDQGSIAFQDPNQVSVREWVCVDMWVYFEDCPGGGGSSSGGGGTIGDGSTGTSSGGIGGGSSSGNNGGNNEEAPVFENILEFCGITGDEGAGAGYELTEQQRKACNALDYLESIEFPQASINYLTDINQMFLLIQIANYIQQGGAYELSLATDYISMLMEGTTSLGFKEFKKLYDLVVNELKPVLGLDEGEVSFLLLENGIIAYQLKSFFGEFGTNDETKYFGEYFVNILSQNLGVTADDLFDAWEWKEVIANSDNIVEEEEHIHDVLILASEALSEMPDQVTNIGQNTSRADDGDPDLLNNQTLAEVNQTMQQKTDDELFTEMTSMFHLMSTGDRQTAGDQFIAEFRTNTGFSPYGNVEYVNILATQSVLSSNTMKNFVRDKFGTKFNEYLKQNDGNIDNININININLGDDCPSFGSKWHKFNGLTILINDTEHTTFHILDDFTVDSNTGKWEGTFIFNISDNFGLDHPDVIKYQSVNDGFAAWYILQHDRGYVPMRTKIYLSYKLKGNFNL